ncbi:hypothetical protein PM022_07980 [Halorubrum ezzemoulense]|uniref:hypothetical protein n=1 Tax=Halorubrum ezzemoulense TaxID=337243 RepID=UPI00232C8506|nr:hypothetical protein [Halorubrum ezzemoulense]MDB2274483.1 hypothetical protein [Halorubrum ezzemoulense]
MDTIASHLAQLSQIQFASEIIAAGLGAVGTVLAYEYRRWRQSSKEEKEKAKTWYKEVEGILANASVKSRGSLLRSDPNREELANDFNEISMRLNTKSETAPDRVSDDATNLIKGLVPVFKKAATVAEVTNEKDGYEALGEMFEIAQKEYSEDFDLSSAMTDAMEHSDLFDNMTTQLSQLGMDSEEFSRRMEKMLEEWETEEFVYFISQFNDEDSVDNVFSLPNLLALEVTASISHEAHSIIEDMERSQLSS